MKIKAAVARGIGAPFSIETVDLEEPRPDEARVRLVATGICHTDISMRDHKIYPVPHPVVLGHEGAGIVEAVGSAVAKVKPGDRVILASASCGHCKCCQGGTPFYCYEFNELNFAGGRADGSSPFSQNGEKLHYYQGQSSFATHTIIRERALVKVGAEAPLELLGPLGCGVITGAGGIINSLKVGVDASVAVFGTGSVGLSAIMAAKLVGAGEIVAVDLVDSRLALARELGATTTINPTRDSVPDVVRRLTGRGVDFTFETTANMDVLRQAVDILAPRGTCGFVGGAPKGMSLTIDVEHVMTGGRTIRGIIEGDANPDIFLPQLADLITRGRFPLEKLVTYYPFEAINQAVEDSLRGDVVKPILRFAA
jgi:aryl-alcohol dehydrogenase